MSFVKNRNSYMAHYMNERYHQRRSAAVALLGGRCVKCGSVEGLEIDHKDPTQKTAEISKLMSRGEIRWRTELELCQLLCATCHRIKSASEQSVEHGGGVSGKRNCKCTPCRARKAEYMKVYKARARS